MDNLIKDDYVSSSDVLSEPDDLEILDVVNDEKSIELPSNDTSSSTLNSFKRRRVRILSNDSIIDATINLSLNETIPDDAPSVGHSNEQPNSKKGNGRSRRKPNIFI